MMGLGLSQLHFPDSLVTVSPLESANQGTRRRQESRGKETPLAPLYFVAVLSQSSSWSKLLWVITEPVWGLFIALTGMNSSSLGPFLCFWSLVTLTTSLLYSPLEMRPVSCSSFLSRIHQFLPLCFFSPPNTSATSSQYSIPHRNTHCSIWFPEWNLTDTYIYFSLIMVRVFLEDKVHFWLRFVSSGPGDRP